MARIEYRLNGDACEYIDGNGVIVATVTPTKNGQWLVQAGDEYMHGTSTMWWKSNQAAKYHVLAIHAEKSDN